MLRSNLGFRIKHKTRSLINKWIEERGGMGIYGLKSDEFKAGQNALLIYTAEALSAKLSGKLKDFIQFNNHSGFRESLLLLEALLEAGYTVDFLHLHDTPKIEWTKYKLVIDAGQNLENAPEVSGQKRIYYSTSCHWKVFLNNQLQRVDSFQNRNGLLLKPDRQIVAGYSDDRADLISIFGGDYQKESFGANASKIVPITITSSFLPKTFIKNFSGKKKFLWYGGYGPFHKGLDLVVEAFRELANCELHVMGFLDYDPVFKTWFLEQLATYSNLHYHGWLRPDSPDFQYWAGECDAVVFASSSEGGSGSIIQCLQYGLIPILNSASGIRLESSTFKITGKTPEEEIVSIREQVKLFCDTKVSELQALSANIQEMSRQVFQADHYKKDWAVILNKLN